MHELAAWRGNMVTPSCSAEDTGGGRLVRLEANVLPQVRWLRELEQGAPSAPERGGRFVIASPADLPRAEDWLLQSLIKDTEGFMSRHFERRISLAVSRRLAGTRVTPNAMTLVSVGVGLAGAALFLSARPGAAVAGPPLLPLPS